MSTEYNKIEPTKQVVTEVDEIEVIQERPKLTAVVKGKKVKRGLVERLVVGLIGPDGIGSVGGKIKNEIVIPAVKNILVDSFAGVTDTLRDSVQAAIFGEDSVRRNQPPSNYYGGNSNRYWRSQTERSYTKYSNAYGNVTSPEPMIHRSNSGVQEIVMSRQEALDVIAILKQQIANYGSARLADYYDLVGVETNYTDNDYGWVNLKNVRIQTVRNGVIIQFPPMEVV